MIASVYPCGHGDEHSLVGSLVIQVDALPSPIWYALVDEVQHSDAASRFMSHNKACQPFIVSPHMSIGIADDSR